MWKKSEVWKSKKFCLLVALELLLLIGGIVGLSFGNRLAADENTMEVNLIEGKILEEDGNKSFYIDENCGSAGNFLEMHPAKLTPGVYRMEITFAAQDNGSSYFGIENRGGIFRGLLSNTVSLYSGIESQTLQFYVTDTSEEAYAYVNYSGTGALWVSGIRLIHTNAGSRIFLFLVTSVSFLADTLIMLYCYLGKYPVERDRKLVWFGIPFLAVLSSLPVFTDYMIIGADSIFHWMRIEALAQSIRQGNLPARVEAVWLYGHGYANSIFYGDTFLTLPALLRLIGFDMNVSYGIFVFAVNLATAWIAYLSMKGMFRSRYIGLLGSMLYTLAPYRVYNIYNRGAVGEYTAMIFLPLLCYGFYLIFTEDIHKKEYKRYWMIPAAAFSGIIQSHVLSCEMAGGFVILPCLILIKKVFRKETFIELVKVVAGTILLNLWFLVPFLDMTLSGTYYFSNNTGTTIQNRGVLPANFFDTMQAAGSNSRFHEKGLLDTEPIGVGIAMLLGVTAFFLCKSLWKSKEAEKKQEKTAMAAWILGVTALVMSTSIFPWNWIQGLGKITGTLVPMLQFPTRLTIIPTVCFTVTACGAAGMIFAKGSPFIKKSFVVLLCGSAILFSLYQTNDTLFAREGMIRLYSIEGIGHSAILGGEYLPLGSQLTYRYHEAEPSAGVEVTAYEKENLDTMTALSVENGSGEYYVELPMLYYKGYCAKDAATGKRLTVTAGENNVVRVMLPSGYQGTVHTWYAGMWYWRATEVISLLFFAYMVLNLNINKK